MTTSYKDLQRQYNELRRKQEETRQRRKELEKYKQQRLQEKIDLIRQSIAKDEEAIQQLEASSSSEETEKTQTIEPPCGETPTKIQKYKSHIQPRQIAPRISRSASTEKEISPEAQVWNIGDSDNSVDTVQNQPTSSKPSRSKQDKELRTNARDSSEKENSSPRTEEPSIQLRKQPVVKLRRLGERSRDRNILAKRKEDDNSNKLSSKQQTRSYYRERTPNPRKSSKADKLERRREQKRLANQRYRRKVKETLEAAKRQLAHARSDTTDSSDAEPTRVTPVNSPSGGSVQRPIPAVQRGRKAERKAATRDETESRDAKLIRRPVIVEDRRQSPKIRVKKQSHHQQGTVVGGRAGERNLTTPTRRPGPSQDHPNRARSIQDHPDLERSIQDRPRQERSNQHHPDRERTVSDHPDLERTIRDHQDLEMQDRDHQDLEVSDRDQRDLEVQEPDLETRERDHPDLEGRDPKDPDPEGSDHEYPDPEDPEIMKQICEGEDPEHRPGGNDNEDDDRRVLLQWLTGPE
ncbi:hypothetical protein EAI_09093 [Harpegnathos saltator]|uniref:Uncharacterized protein n=1 Tax=Harpegnathos saltator TaxID=610380 RepID=E2BQY3_HARSA|nr:hypothetical protein EAI_09093 [Harpegnathos saltator]